MCASSSPALPISVLVSFLTRAGYRPLLEAGVRVFEWNGTMLHAKTAVADGQWARVGSTNLNIASWMGNRELDVIVEDVAFAKKLEAMFESDLENATEVTLNAGRVRRASRGRRRRPRARGSAGRAVAGAVRIGSTVTAAMTNQRVLEPVEANIALGAGALLLGACPVARRVFPRAFAYPLAVIALWLAATFLYRSFALFRTRRVNPRPTDAPQPGAECCRSPDAMPIRTETPSHL